MTEYRVLDLFCGLGGFSQAFEGSDRWAVTTVDIEARFEPDIHADVFDLRPSDFDREFDVVLASPPCTQFSTAGNHGNWDFETNTPVADASQDAVALVHHTVGLIRGLCPRFWFLENPQGRLRWFLGEPTGKVTYCQYGRRFMKRTDLWGDHPPMSYRTCKRGSPCHDGNVEYDGTSATRLLGETHAERAKVPADLSAAIRDACEAGLDGAVAEQVTFEEVPSDD